MRQTILTFIAEIDPAKKDNLKVILASIREKLSQNNYIRFQDVSLLHFASFVIANDDTDQPQLIFENNFDGDVHAYLNELTGVAGAGLHSIYSCCLAYSGSTFDKDYLTQFLENRIVRPNAYHIGNVGRAAKVVRENQQVRETMQQKLDDLFSKKAPAGYTAQELRRELLSAVTGASGLPEELPSHQTFAEKFIPWMNLILFALIFGLPIIVVGLIILPYLRWLEKKDLPDNKPASAADISQFISTENRITQNHLAVITDVKTPKFRLYLLRFVLFAVNLIARTATKGKLSGIPSIHFAHWSVINGGTQMLFLSNYDGSWISYLDDFIDKAARGLTGIWSNSQGFPATRFLILDGARDELEFKAYSRNHQVPSLVWYSAYRDLTVQNIDKDSKIREAIPGTPTDTETGAWLKLF